MRCTIKPMTLADYDEVLHLWQSAEGVGLNESDTRRAIARYLKRNRRRFWRANGWKKRLELCMAQKDLGSSRTKRGC
jgi:hypothetical protein